MFPDPKGEHLGREVLMALWLLPSAACPEHPTNEVAP